MTGMATELDEAISQAVIGLRKTGYSWAENAIRLSVTHQAAQQRWGHRQRRTPNRWVPTVMQPGASRLLTAV